MVVDEYGEDARHRHRDRHLEGIAGSLPERGEDDDPFVVPARRMACWLVDGPMPIDEFEDICGVSGLRDDAISTPWRAS